MHDEGGEPALFVSCQVSSIDGNPLLDPPSLPFLAYALAHRFCPRLSIVLVTIASADAQVLRTQDGIGAHARLGNCVAVPGDCNGDGVDDYFMGVLARLYSGADGSLVWARDSVYVTVADRLGDVNGDGVPDLIAGGGATSTGTATIFSGADGTTIRSRTATLFPLDVAGLDDVDGDGVEDYAGLKQNGTERVRVYSSSTGVVLWTADLAAQRLTRIGDVTADGVDDLLIGDSGYWFGVGAIGRAIVLDETDGAIVRVHRCDPVIFGQAMGSYVAGLDDADGDGVDDYAVAAPRRFDPVADAAWVDVYSGATGEGLKRWSAPGSNDFGVGMTRVPDLDGDGRDELALLIPGQNAGPNGLGTPGQVQICSGGTGPIIGLLATCDRPGPDVCVGPDIDRDGLPELLVPHPFHGTASASFVGRVECHRFPPVGSLSAPYCPGAPNVTALAAELTTTGIPSFSAGSLTLDVTGLPPSTFGLFVMGHDSYEAPLANGTRCTLQQYRILPIVSTGSGDVSFPIDLAALALPLNRIQPGTTRAFQFWYRDGIGAGANLSNGLFVAFLD